MTRSLFALAFGVALAGMTADAITATSGPGPGMTSHVEHMATDTKPARPIDGATARLMTTPNGATMTISTSDLTPGNVTTAWWLVITKPMLCEAKPCSPGDVIGRADIVGTQIVYADGVVNSVDGSDRFSAFLPKGVVQNGWYDTSFDNPTEAEIHLVLNDHGSLVSEIAASMLTS